MRQTCTESLQSCQCSSFKKSLPATESNIADSPCRANETKPISVVVTAGVDALSTRAVLVVLGAILEADVPQGSDHYTVNPNGTITVDYIQTDGIALQKVNVREIHSFDDDCQITGITGYIRGNIEAFLGNVNIPKLLDQMTPGVSLGALVAMSLGTL